MAEPITGTGDLTLDDRVRCAGRDMDSAAAGTADAGISNGTGTEWIVEAFDCDVRRLCDLGVIANLCDRVVADLGLNVLGSPQLHQFPHPGGVTALYMLSESHLACHTYPEFRLATFNLYCCRVRPAWDWERHLASDLHSRSVEVKQIARGIPNRSIGLGGQS